MRKLLVILFLLGAFLLYSYAGQEEEKGKVVIIDPNDTTMIYDWPLWLFNHGYTSYYDSSWIYNYRYSRGSGAIVLRKPPSFSESFLIGLSRGLSKSTDYYYRAREQRQYTKATMALIKLKWANEGYYSKPKYSQPHEYRNEYKMSPQEERANWERIKELDRIIKLKKERARLDKLFREAGWLDKDRIEYLDKYYPLPSKIEKEEDDFTKYMRSIGAMLPWEYKTMKLNEYLKSQGLSPVPTNVDVNQVFDGEWVIYWNGKEWTRKKKDLK